MSHISKIELEVRDLAGPRTMPAKGWGLSLSKGRRHLNGTERRRCDHAIKVPGADYEIGVVKTSSACELSCDYYDRNIEKAIGTQGGLLKQAYAVEKTKDRGPEKRLLRDGKTNPNRHPPACADLHERRLNYEGNHHRCLRMMEKSGSRQEAFPGKAASPNLNS